MGGSGSKEGIQHRRHLTEARSEARSALPALFHEGGPLGGAIERDFRPQSIAHNTGENSRGREFIIGLHTERPNFPHDHPETEYVHLFCDFIVGGYLSIFIQRME